MILKKLIKFQRLKNLKILRYSKENNIIEKKPELQIEKIRYKKINYLLDKLDILDNKFEKIKTNKFFYFYYLLMLGSFYVGYKMREKYESSKKKITEEKITEEFEKIITNSIIKFVFHNKGLYKDLQKVLSEFLKKDPTEIFITKLLERLLRSKILFEKADELVRNKLLLKIVLQDDEIEEKLKNIIKKVLKNSETRKSLMSGLRNFVNSSTAIDLTIKGSYNGLINETVNETFSKEIKGFIYEKLDEKIYFKILTEAIIDLLKNIKF